MQHLHRFDMPDCGGLVDQQVPGNRVAHVTDLVGGLGGLRFRACGVESGCFLGFVAGIL